MNAKQQLDALEIALTNESQERKFYLNNAERSRNPLGKALFLQIAEDELEHYERLKQLHEVWLKREEWPDSLPLTVRGTPVKDVLQGVLEKMKDTTPGDPDELAALRTAIEFESRGVAHYAALRDSVTDPRQKKFFDLLSGIEREHYASLRETEEFLTDPAGWYRSKERPTLEG